MKILTKVALVSAMAISANAMAMQSMDDESLSAATGQDGVTITLTGPITMDYLAIVDGDGVGDGNYGVTTSSAGAIVVGNSATGFGITPGTNGIKLVIDADGGNTTGATGTTGPVLNVNADLGTTKVNVGSIGVAKSNATGSALTQRVDVLDVGEITLNNLKANIQLGSQPQGALIKVNSTVTNGVTLSNVNIKQGLNGIGLGEVKVTDATGTDLTLALNINANANGLQISGITPMNVSASRLALGELATYTPADPTATPPTTASWTGGTAALGAMYIKNLNVGTGLTISGH